MKLPEAGLKKIILSNDFAAHTYTAKAQKSFNGKDDKKQWTKYQSQTKKHTVQYQKT